MSLGIRTQHELVPTHPADRGGLGPLSSLAGFALHWPQPQLRGLSVGPTCALFLSFVALEHRFRREPSNTARRMLAYSGAASLITAGSYLPRECWDPGPLRPAPWSLDLSVSFGAVVVDFLANPRGESPPRATKWCMSWLSTPVAVRMIHC
jgi:hypothetical protein